MVVLLRISVKKGKDKLKIIKYYFKEEFL